MNNPHQQGVEAVRRDALATTQIIIRKDSNEIILNDTTDQNNLPAGYNRGVQGIKKAFEYIEANIDELQSMTMYRVIDKLEEIAPKLKFHTYCRMD